LLGEQSTVILDVQKVFPKKLQEQNFEFEYPYIDDAISHLLK
ncbi:MAG TPA: epimerase, partial [Staphylococcus sp.]|nr:epimerase [Staphylococcus sp.]